MYKPLDTGFTRATTEHVSNVGLWEPQPPTPKWGSIEVHRRLHTPRAAARTSPFALTSARLRLARRSNATIAWLSCAIFFRGGAACAQCALHDPLRDPTCTKLLLKRAPLPARSPHAPRSALQAAPRHDRLLPRDGRQRLWKTQLH